MTGWTDAIGTRLGKPGMVPIVALNLTPLIGVVWFGWDAGALLILYWAENVIVGVCTLVAMGWRSLRTLAGGMGFVLSAPFFLVHYGLFCAVHGMFALAFARGGLTGASGPDPFDDTLWPWIVQTGVLWGVAGLALAQLLRLVARIASGEIGRTDADKLMFAPYGRIVVLHITLIGGAFAAQAMGQPLGFIILLVLLKTAFELAGDELFAPKGTPLAKPAVTDTSTPERGAQGG
jgi:hypothetical protein